MTVLALMTSYANVKLGLTPGSTVGIAFDEVGASEFDSAYARGTILASSSTEEPILDLLANYSEFWLHFEVYAVGNLSANGGTGLSFYSAAGELQYAFMGTATGGQMHFYKSTNNTTFNTRMGTGDVIFAPSARHVVDVQVKNAASGGIFNVFLNGTLTASFSGDTSTNGANAVRYIRFRTPTINNTWQISQVVAADMPTVGWKVQELWPVTGTQTFNQWTGTFSDCDDFGLNFAKADSIYANTNGFTESFVVNDVPAGASNMFVAAVAISARAVTAVGSAVQTFTPGVEVGGVFYEGGDYVITPTDGEQIIQTIFHQNPATASGWTQSNVNAMQIGVRAKT